MSRLRDVRLGVRVNLVIFANCLRTSQVAFLNSGNTARTHHDGQIRQTTAVTSTCLARAKGDCQDDAQPQCASGSIVTIFRTDERTTQPVRRPTTKDLLEMDEMKLHRKLFTVQNQSAESAAPDQSLMTHQDISAALTSRRAPSNREVYWCPSRDA